MKLHKRLAALFGYELIKLSKQPSSEAHLLNLVHHLGIDLVLDVGANEGQFGRRLRDRGYRGQIHSFEPVGETFERLRQASGQDPNWHVHRMALGAEPGEALINVTASSDLASFLDPNDFGSERYQNIAVASQERVPISTVDLFLAGLKDDVVSANILLKMDTQGFDLNVFRGATQSLGRVAALLSELSIAPIYANMPHYLEALKVYEDAGFALTGLYPISRKPDLSLIEMDCMMINRALAS